MNIWLICQYYKPEPGAPSSRLSGLAGVWRQEGANVTVLTALPNHPKGVIHDDYADKPAFFDEDMDGVRVRRHWLYVTRNEGFYKKVLCHLSFAASVLLANLTPRGAYPGVIVASSPSFFAAISGWLLARRYGVPFVMEVRDLWPGIFVELGVMKPGGPLNFLEKVEMFLYRQAAAVVTVTRGFARNIVERGIAADKVYVITNGVSDTDLAAAAQPEQETAVMKLRNELQINPLSRVVLYIGTHGTSQALGQIIDAARLLMARSDILFLFVGDGADKDRLKRISRGMPNVQFMSARDKEQVWTFYAMSYLCLVPLKDTPGFATFIPSKMFEIMAAGRPIVASLAGEAADILRQSGGAMVAPSETPDKLAAAILALVDDTERAQAMGAAGRKFVTAHFRHGVLARQYLGILKKITGAAETGGAKGA